MIKLEYRVQTRKVNEIVSKNMDEMTVEWLNEIGNDGCELVPINTKDTNFNNRHLPHSLCAWVGDILVLDVEGVKVLKG